MNHKGTPEGQDPEPGPEGDGPPAQGRHPETHSISSLPPCTDDKLEQQHSLFTRFKDPCRLGPGEEKPWAIGELGIGLRGAEGTWGKGGALPISEPTMLRPDTAPRLGSPQLPREASKTCPQDPTCPSYPRDVALLEAGCALPVVTTLTPCPQVPCWTRMASTMRT